MRISPLAASLIVLGLAAPARAELVFFASGQTMSIKAHRVDSDRLVLMLRGGGEITCEPALIARIAPDEVAYPEDPDVRLKADVTYNLAADVDRSVRLQPDALAVRYGALIDKVAGEQGVSARLVRAVISVESAGQPRARSARGAVGLMQLMPETARLYTTNNPFDPATNIEAGVKHLRTLLDRLPLREALAAYNAGEGAVQRFGGIPPYPETQRYVAQVLRLIGR